MGEQLSLFDIIEKEIHPLELLKHKGEVLHYRIEDNTSFPSDYPLDGAAILEDVSYMDDLGICVKIRHEARQAAVTMFLNADKPQIRFYKEA